MPELRVDAGLPLRGPTRTGQGFWRFDTAPVARAGIYEYPQPDGSVRRELRPEEEVFSPASLASYDAAPITSGHPSGAEVNARNVRLLKVGTVMGPGRRGDGDHVVAPIVVEDETAIREARERKRNQLSPGYRIDLEETSGTHPRWGRYHAIQRNIRVNHLALVTHARGGDSLQIRLDGLDSDVRVGVRVDDEDAAPRRGDTMDPEEQIRLLKSQLADAEKQDKIRQDEAERADRRAQMAEAAVAPLHERIGDLERIVAEGASQVETEAVAREKIRADAAEEAVRQFDDRFEAGVQARAHLMHRVGLVMGSKFRMDDLNERQLHEAVIRRLDSKVNLKDESDAFVAGRFETLYGLHTRTARSFNRLTDEVTHHNRTDARDGRSPADDRDARKKAFRDQWKKPLPNDIRASREGR